VVTQEMMWIIMELNIKDVPRMALLVGQSLASGVLIIIIHLGRI
jgi:hypothetical protein